MEISSYNIGMRPGVLGNKNNLVSNQSLIKIFFFFLAVGLYLYFTPMFFFLNINKYNPQSVYKYCVDIISEAAGIVFKKKPSNLIFDLTLTL